MKDKTSYIILNRSNGLPLNSVKGYIAYKVYGVKEGETVFSPGFVICAVLQFGWYM
ncbi:hypothetical protein [Clostridium sp. UBA7339]|uniref:hypothetical protein n=1 Tax=Clostridium sp. UBA7339 TaxID=1946376 RepID=UPI0032177B16